MNFAIEVPGEASPLSLQELYGRLVLAAGHDANQRQTALQQLEAWGSYPDYFPLLQTIFLDRSLQRDVRYLAIILLKNGIDKSWRSVTVKAVIPAEQKALIRSRLYQGSIDEEDKSLALHNALAAAKVVRIDYPNEWPTALSELVGFLAAAKAGDQQPRLSGALLVLLRTVKELARARLRKSQTALQEATPELVMLVGEIYSSQVAFWMEFLTRGRGDEDVADYAMENSLACIKILRRLITVGYDKPHREPLAQEFWALSQTQFGQFLGHVSHDSAVPAPYQDVVGKHLLQFTKLHIEVAENLPTSFALLPNSIALVHAYWDLVARFAEVFDKSGGIQKSSASEGGDGGAGKSKVEGPLLERLALKGLLLLRHCISMVFRPQQTFKYKSEDFLQDQEQAKQRMKAELLTNQFVTQIVDVIITKLFIFRKADLDAWEEDPQEWEAQERDSGDAWIWEVRPCAERVFLDLLINYKNLLGPPLLHYFETSAKTSSDDIVSKEAVYTAMGCAAPTVYEVFDFDSFVTSTLVGDVQLQGGLAKLLRRRIAILLSQWVPIKIADDTRPVIFEIYRHLLNPDDATNDQVVRITAARQLKLIADDFEFRGEIFQPFAYEVLRRLIGLLEELEHDDTKLAVLDTVRVLVNRMEASARQVGDDLMAALAQLWADADEGNFMLKQSVLTILSTLVGSMGAESRRYHTFLVPLIREAMDPDSKVHKFLVDEAAEVWKTMLTQCPAPAPPELIELEPVGLPFIEYDNALSLELVHILYAYGLLVPEGVLADPRRRPTLQALAGAIEAKQRDMVHWAAKVVDLILRSALELGGAGGLAVVVRDLLEIGFLPLILERLHNAWECHQTTGPNRKTSRLEGVKETLYFSILARVAVGDPAALVHLMAAAGSPQAVWQWLSAEWFACFDMMADCERQKLSCLALTRLLEVAAEPSSLSASPSASLSNNMSVGSDTIRELVLGKLQDYFAMWTMVVGEVQDGDAAAPDTLIWGPPSAGGHGVEQVPEDEGIGSEFESPQDVREREFAKRDPVRTEHTFTFIKLRLQALVASVGGEGPFAEHWTVNVDKDVLAGFQALSTPGGSGGR